MWELLWGLGSGGLGPAPGPTPPVPVLCSGPAWVPRLCPELKSLGALSVNSRAVPSSPCTGWRPSLDGWCQGSPCSRQRCSVTSPKGGDRLVLSLSEGRMGATDRKCSWPYCSHGDPAAQQPHQLLLMSGGQLLFPRVFWAASWERPGVVDGAGAGVRWRGAA